MASVTYWNRLEPRPRGASIADTLGARIRDPLWMLTRQWQFGEFHGEDAGSPAYVQLDTTTTPVVGWGLEQRATESITGAPLERLSESEPFNPNDLSLRVELGQTFELLLAQAGAGTAVKDAFRTAYPIPQQPEAALVASPDQETARFERVCGGRAIDGIALYEAAVAHQPSVPPDPVLTAAERAAVLPVLDRYRGWVDEVFPSLGKQDPPSWKPARLEYGIDVVAESPGGGSAVFSTEPDRDGEFDWHAFDLRAISPPGRVSPVGRPPERRSVIPTHVRFLGMPNHRWWDFELGTSDWGAIAPEKPDLAKLVVMDFMLVAGNDWFAIPLDQPLGSLCRIDSLVVHDVFGGRTVVERADAVPAPIGQRWTMFSTSTVGDPAALADFFVLPPSAATVIQTSAPIEEVRFLRDEMLNAAWAIEHATENGIGSPWLGHERDLASKAAVPAPTAVPSPTDESIPLRYELQTFVPEHWIPLIPVAIDPLQGEIALELGSMVRSSGGTYEPIVPLGRILRPTSLSGAPYQIREEEVPRAGVRVSRVICRARWIDGSTHLWIARRKAVGAGEGSSGLRFDLALPAG